MGYDDYRGKPEVTDRLHVNHVNGVTFGSMVGNLT